MKRIKLSPLVLAGASGSLFWGLFFAIQLLQALGAKQNSYWTARTMPLRIEQTKDAFELRIGGKPLEELVYGRTLLVRSNGNTTPVSSADMAVRLNNWHKVRSSFLTHALWSGMVFSACLTLTVVGLFLPRAAKDRDRGLPPGAEVVPRAAQR